MWIAAMVHLHIRVSYPRDHQCSCQAACPTTITKTRLGMGASDFCVSGYDRLAAVESLGLSKSPAKLFKR